MSDIKSSNYGKHKSYDEIRQLVANSLATEAVSQWLLENGIHITFKSSYGEYITASTSVAVLENAFDTTIHVYEATNGDEKIVMRASSYSLSDDIYDHTHSVCTVRYSIR